MNLFTGEFGADDAECRENAKNWDGMGRKGQKGFVNKSGKLMIFVWF